MAISKKNCGNCRFFVKLKQDKFGSGICDAHDARVNTDSKKCSLWKGIKYIRV